jgi:hypothetical protein
MTFVGTEVETLGDGHLKAHVCRDGYPSPFYKADQYYLTCTETPSVRYHDAGMANRSRCSSSHAPTSHHPLSCRAHGPCMRCSRMHPRATPSPPVHREDNEEHRCSTCDKDGGSSLLRPKTRRSLLAPANRVARHVPSLGRQMQSTAECRRPARDRGCHTLYAAVDVVCVRNALGGEAQPKCP